MTNHDSLNITGYQVAILALVVGLLGTLSGCGDNALATQEPEEHAFEVQMEAGHVHVFGETEVLFWVRDLEDCSDPEDISSCAAVPDLPVEAFYRGGHGGAMRTQELDGEGLVDNGDGSYTWKRSFNDLGAYTLGLRFKQHGVRYFGAFPLETSKAGSERLFCDSDGDGADDRAFQIRWESSDGHMHAGGEEPVVFSLELMRSFNDSIDTEQPWTNKFDHLTPAKLDASKPTVELMRGEGDEAEVISELDTTYQGRGIYDVEFSFEESHLTGGHDHGTHFWLNVSFVDDLGCTVDGGAHAEEFMFEVVSPH